jgi:hypothetical protein
MTHGEASFASNFAHSAEGTVVGPLRSGGLDENNAFTREAHPPGPNNHQDRSRESRVGRQSISRDFCDGGFTMTESPEKCSTDQDDLIIYVSYIGLRKLSD